MDDVKGCASVTNQTHVNTQMNIVDSTLARLQKGVEELEGKLSPVLTPQYPRDVNEKIEQLDELVPLADDIRNLNQRIGRISSTIHEINERLEV